MVLTLLCMVTLKVRIHYSVNDAYTALARDPFSRQFYLDQDCQSLPLTQKRLDDAFRWQGADKAVNVFTPGVDRPAIRIQRHA